MEFLQQKGYTRFFEIRENKGWQNETCTLHPLSTLEDRYYALILAQH
jgi:hypothetical protein